MDSDLPNNNLSQNNPPQPLDNNQDQNDFGLDYQPQSPISGETVPFSQTQPEISTAPEFSENQKPAETLPTIEKETPIPMPTAAQLQQEPNTIVVPIQNTQEPPKVVDNTDKITTLHHVVDTTDNLTKEADQDEEHFIEEVEKHHGHQ